MKVFIIGFLAAVALAEAEHNHDPLNINDVHERCQQDPKVYVDESVFEEIKKHGKNAKLPENFGKHVVCMVKGMGMMGPNGEVVAEGVKAHVRYVEKNGAKQEAIVKECSVNKATAEGTAQSLWGCLSKNHILAGPRHHYK